MNKIYASTNCLKSPKNVLKVLDEYEKVNIENVELGSVHSYFDTRKLKDYNFNFIIHNYFPPPKDPFNFNLASSDMTIRRKSINLAKNAINLCTNLNSPLYTFHAGFTIDPKKLGVAFDRSNVNDRKKSFENFIEGVLEIIEYAKKTDVKIAFEPNVVQEFNLINGKNELLLLAEYDEIEKFYTFISEKEIGILLDLGHMAVTSTWLKFDKNDFVSKCVNKVSAIHISNNDGLKDQHNSLTQNCWALSKLKFFKEKFIVLETMNLTIEQILSNINLVKKTLN